jgi:hypothetical protein
LHDSAKLVFTAIAFITAIGIAGSQCSSRKAKPTTQTSPKKAERAKKEAPPVATAPSRPTLPNRPNCPKFFDPFHDVRVGATYFIPGRTPLMPHYDPPDPAAAIRQMDYIEGIPVRVVAIKHVGSYPWYEVQSNIRRGWVNSVALAGQCVEEVPTRP